MQTEKHDIIILRGAPGSGKSETAKSLSKFFPTGARLEVDTIRNMVISVDWKNQQEHINMLQVSANLAIEFFKLGFNPVIVVDTFSGNKLVRYLDTLFQLDSNLSIKIFGLFTTEEELKKRLELRPNGEFKDFPICKKLNAELQQAKYDNEFQIDTTGLLPVQTAKKINRQLLMESINPSWSVPLRPF